MSKADRHANGSSLSESRYGEGQRAGCDKYVCESRSAAEATRRIETDG